MTRAFALRLVCVVLLAFSTVSAHDDHTLDPRDATPGLGLSMTEVDRPSASPAVRYRLHTSGFPRGVVFNVWAQHFGQPFRSVASGFEVEDSGALVSSRRGQRDPGPQPSVTRQNPGGITFGPGPYPRGAVWRVALVSADGALKAFGAAIPHPITARQGACSISLELVSYRGHHFVATGAGFVAGDDIITESRYAGRVTQKRQQVSPLGLLPLDVIAHQPTDGDGSARYTVKGRSCELSVEYNWGRAALVPR